MNESGGHSERVGAMPLTAFHTTPILTAATERDGQDGAMSSYSNTTTNNNNRNQETALGIARKPSLEFEDAVLTTAPSEDSADVGTGSTTDGASTSILMTSDKLGLLRDSQADPPIERTPPRRTNTNDNSINSDNRNAVNSGNLSDLVGSNQQDTVNGGNGQNDDGSEEYHSPAEEEEEMLAMMMGTTNSVVNTSSRTFDFSIDIDTDEPENDTPVHDDDDNNNNNNNNGSISSNDFGMQWNYETPPRRNVSNRQQSATTDSVPSTPVSLADAAAATAFLNTGDDNRTLPVIVREPSPPRSPLHPPPPSPPPPPPPLTSMALSIRDASDSDLSSSFRDILVNPSLPHDAVSTSSSSSGSVTRRRRPRVLRRAPTANQIPETIEEGRDNRLRASLDAGMLALRRWIRSRRSPATPVPLTRTTTASTGTTPTRMWRRNNQLNHSATNLSATTTTTTTVPDQPMGLRLGELDVLALSGHGSLPRRILRERTLSEPENTSLRNSIFQRATNTPSRNSSSSTTNNNRMDAGTLPAWVTTPPSSDGSNPLAVAAYSSSLFHTTTTRATTTGTDGLGRDGLEDPDARINVDSTITTTNITTTSGVHPDLNTSVPDLEEQRGRLEEERRMRWILINLRFRRTISIVAILFSMLKFAMLVSWVVLTCTYVVAIDKTCDVPLKVYFWLATMQLILDVFRADIMRSVLRHDTRAQQQIPVRVVLYNMAYIVYAFMVLRLGVSSVYLSPDATCRNTAPELFQATSAFVSLSIAAWTLLIFGYLLPFGIVAALLTWNGYNPESAMESTSPTFPGVLPSAYTNSGAPPGVIDRVQTVILEEFPDHYPKECCICMSDFAPGEAIVATNCDHVFHKRCFQEWLRHARTCPVCRTDIPRSLGIETDSANGDDNDDREDNREEDNESTSVAAMEEGSRLAFPPWTSQNFTGRDEFSADVVDVIRRLRHDDRMMHQRRRQEEEQQQPQEQQQQQQQQATTRGTQTSTSMLEMIQQ